MKWAVFLIAAACAATALLMCFILLDAKKRQLLLKLTVAAAVVFVGWGAVMALHQVRRPAQAPKQTGKPHDSGPQISFAVPEGQVLTAELGSIALSETSASPQLKSPATFQETVYRKAVVSDAAGNAVLTVTDALVPPAGSFAFINRGNQFRIDDLLVAENETPAETTPAQTAAPETTPGTEPGNTETGDHTGSLLLGVLVLAGLAAGGVLLRRRSLRRKEM